MSITPLKLTGAEELEPATPPPTNMQEALALLDEAKKRARHGVHELLETLKRGQELAEDVARGSGLLPEGVREEGRQLADALQGAVSRITALDIRNGGSVS